MIDAMVMKYHNGLLDKYLDNVLVLGDDECWPWTGPKFNRGYGRISLGPKKALAHVFGWEIMFGLRTPGMVIDHTCHNGTDCLGGDTCPHRACQNPAHWEEVTVQENNRRGRGGEFQRNKTHCPQGHEYTEDNTYLWNGRRHCRRCGQDRLKTPESLDYHREYARKRRAEVKARKDRNDE